MDSLPSVVGSLFPCSVEGVVAQVGGDLGLVRRCREDFVAFPAAERDHANPQPASRFRLKDPELEATTSQVTADGPGLFWDWYSTV